MSEVFEVKESCPVCGETDKLELIPCKLGSQYESDVYCRRCQCKIITSNWNVRSSKAGLSDDDIRALIMRDLPRVKLLMLSAQSISIVNWVNSGERTSQELAAMKSISIQNASTKLSKLYSSGYIERAEAADPTGGVLFIYKSK